MVVKTQRVFSHRIVLYTGLLAVLLVCSEGAALGFPKAVPRETRHNAGEVPQGTMIVHDFEIGNNGNEPLTVEVKDCGCGGVKVKAPTTPIKPGTKDRITVSIPTQRLSGTYKREIRLETNDPEKKELLLTICADIHEIISIKPPYVDFGRVKKGSINKKAICISNNGREPFTILHVEAEPSGIAEISPPLDKVILNPGDKKMFELKLSPRNGDGFMTGVVSIRTDIKHIEEKKIFFRADVSAR